KEEHAAGNHVFVHARSFYFDWCAYVYKNLYNINNPADLVGTSFTFLRFGDGSKTPFTSRIQLTDEKTEDALYMNGALFSNSKYGNRMLAFLFGQHSLFRPDDRFNPEYLFTLFNMQE